MGNTVASGIVDIRLSSNSKLSFTQLRDSLMGVNMANAATAKGFMTTADRMEMLRQKTTGLKREISAFRNDVLLVVFALAGVGREFQKSVDASVKFQVALAGVRSVALATGNDLGGVKEATLELTKDGLLSLSGAAQGLKNLMATGLNLQQAVDLMKVFKNAAAFNRQGILEYEEAIVRATAGVKMQNIRLIDDVGIRTRLGQMMKAQGFELEDLTDKTKKAGAIQALYSGLMNEGRFFIGDAARLTHTFAGAQASLEAQLLKTRAAFGDILTGVSTSTGAFAGGAEFVQRYLRVFQLLILANTDLIKIKIDMYLNKIADIVKGIGAILSPVVSAFSMLGSILGNTVITNFVIWGLLITKLSSKIQMLTGDILKSVGGMRVFAKLSGAYQLGKLGAVAPIAANAFSGVQKYGTYEIAQYGSNYDAKLAAQFKEGTLNKSMRLGGSQVLVSMKQYREEFAKSIAGLEKSAASLSVKTLPAFNKQMKDISNTFRIPVQALEQNIPAVAAKVATLNTVMATSQTGLAGVKAGMLGLAKQAGATAMSIGSGIAAFVKANAAMIGFQAVILGLIWLYDKYTEKENYLKSIQETRANAITQLAQAEKDAFDSKVAEISSIQGLMEEYKSLNEGMDKNEASYKRMSTIEAKISEIMSKYNITIGERINLQKNFNTVLQQTDDITRKLNQEQLEARRIDLEMIKLRKQQAVGQDFSSVDEIDKLLRSTIENQLPEFRDYINKYLLTTTEDMQLDSRGGVSKTMSVSLTKDQRGTGEYLLNLYDLVEKRIKDNERALTDLGKKMYDVKKAGGPGMEAAIADMNNLANSYRLGTEAAQRFLAKLVEGKITSADYAAELAGINSQQEKFNMLVNAEKNADMSNFLDAWRTRVAKTKVTGDLGDKLLEAFGTAARGRNDLAAKKGVTARDAAEGKALIDEFSRNVSGKILREGTENISKLLQVIYLDYQKLNAAPDVVKGIEIAQKKLNEQLKIQNELAGVNSVVSQLKTRLKLLGGASDIEKQTEGWRSETSAIRMAIGVFSNYANKLKAAMPIMLATISIEEKRAEILEKLKNQQAAISGYGDIERQRLTLSYAQRTLGLQADYADGLNLERDFKLKLLDIETRRGTLVSQISEATITNDSIALTIKRLQLAQLDQELIVEAQIYQYAAKKLAIEKALEKSEKQRNTALTVSNSKGTLTGALRDIGSGGTGTIASVLEYQNTVQTANEKLGSSFDLFNEDTWDALSTYQDAVTKANDNVLASFEQTFMSIARFAEDTFDIFGLKSWEASENIKYNLITDQKLLDDQFAHREITVAEYEAQRTLLNKKASIETRKNAALESAEQKIAIGNTLKSLALEFAVRALAATALGFLGNPSGFKSAAAYSAAAALAGGTGIALAKSGITDKAKAEAEARLAETLAERDATRTSGTTTSTDTGGKSIGGSIQAQELHIYISPTTTISGETIIISNIGIEEAKQILADATVTRIQEAIDNRELQLVPK